MGGNEGLEAEGGSFSKFHRVHLREGTCDQHLTTLSRNPLIRHHHSHSEPSRHCALEGPSISLCPPRCRSSLTSLRDDILASSAMSENLHQQPDCSLYSILQD